MIYSSGNIIKSEENLLLFICGFRKNNNKKIFMNITWYGHSCFKIQTKSQRGSDGVTIIIDPFDKKIGLRPPQGNADVVTISHGHDDHNNARAIKGDPFVVDAPGEYSIKGIQIEGIDSFHDKVKGEERGRNTIFTFESEGLKICHLGDLGHVLTERQSEKIGSIDVLMIPVGGKFTLNAKDAEEVMGQIDPRIIIPMHYKIKGLKIEGLDDEKGFCSEFGGQVEKGIGKFNFKKKDLENIENKILILDVFSN
jgi:L-ascorbate metabolism protein UlaG (beta-lactamase superfamily)